MATSSSIALFDIDGTITRVRCHCNGYPAFNGRVLVSRYNSRQHAEQLVSSGDIISLIDAPLSDQTHATIPLLTKRKACKSRKFPSLNDYMSDKMRFVDYHYLFMNEKWLLVLPKIRATIPVEDYLSI